MKKFFFDKKNQIILLLCFLFLVKAPQEGIRFVLWVIGGVISAGLCDILIKYLFSRAKIIPKSAIISGFITAGIIDYHQSWLVLVAFSFLAIISKNIIKYKKQHIFNPANFALFAAALLKIPLTWNIESNIYVIVLFGIYMAYAIKKTTHVLGFLLFFSGLLMTQGVNLLPLISCFFLFIMLIEPKTSGFGALRGFVFGSIAGISSFLIYKFLPGYDFFVCALFAANLCTLFLEKIKK